MAKALRLHRLEVAYMTSLYNKKKFRGIALSLYARRGPFNIYLFVDECKVSGAFHSIPTLREFKKIMREIGFVAVGRNPSEPLNGRRLITYGPKEVKK